ncbi:MAG TPA: LysR family transcriptional regulator [Kofleriaceae bacterium]|nr:LysR family transcriptional regulator [Kofleriaceae bacterium]
MDWDDVRHFLALARTGSVRAAGASLAVSHSTVARRVETLERRLGVKLFDRNRDGYLLTDAGQDMLAGAERVEREMAAIERGLAGQDARLEGRVRVTCTDAYVGRMLLSALSGLCTEHPGLELELHADGAYLDLSKREADIAVRAVGAGGTPPEHLIGRRLVPIVVASYVGVAHAARLDPERGGGGRVRWLGYAMPVAERLVARSSYPELPIWGAFESLELMSDAAHAGLGLAMLPTYVGDADARLQRLASADVRHMADFWLLTHRDLRDNARLRVAREQITAAFTERMALFRGHVEG